jgi:hypothetical protein
VVLVVPAVGQIPVQKSGTDGKSLVSFPFSKRRAQ